MLLSLLPGNVYDDDDDDDYDDNILGGVVIVILPGVMKTGLANTS